MNTNMSAKGGSASGGKKFFSLLVIVAGLLFFYIGYIYATHAAGALPHYFPGFMVGAKNIHTKHSIAAFLLGIACLIFGWFQSGSKNASA